MIKNPVNLCEWSDRIIVLDGLLLQYHSILFLSMLRLPREESAKEHHGRPAHKPEGDCQPQNDIARQHEQPFELIWKRFEGYVFPKKVQFQYENCSSKEWMNSS